MAHGDTWRASAFYDIVPANEFLFVTPEAQITKSKVDKLYHIAFTDTTYSLKETAHRVKQQLTEGEKIIENLICAEGLISKIHKKFLQLNNNKINKSPY